jgi:hypothetical protein
MTNNHSHPLYHRDGEGKLIEPWQTTLTPYGLKVECRACGRFYGYEPFEAANLPKRPVADGVPRLTKRIERINPRKYAFHPANKLAAEDL